MAGDPFYNRREWRDRLQPGQLARAPMCEWPHCDKPATVADHIVPIKQGGAKRDRANFQSLCDQHHNVKRAAERHGKDWRVEAFKGCDINGYPLDPTHPWNAGGGSITRNDVLTTGGGDANRISKGC